MTHDQEEALALGDRVAVLDQGRLQQLAVPVRLYASPANRMVARFIGSPPMNLLDGTLLVRNDGRMVLAEGQECYPLPPALGCRWRCHLERKVSLGIRPEHVRLATPGGQGGLDWTVVHVEKLGANELVALQRGPWQILARAPDARPWRNGVVLVWSGRPIRLTCLIGRPGR